MIFNQLYGIVVQIKNYCKTYKCAFVLTENGKKRYIYNPYIYHLELLDQVILRKTHFLTDFTNIKRLNKQNLFEYLSVIYICQLIESYLMLDMNCKESLKTLQIIINEKISWKVFESHLSHISHNRNDFIEQSLIHLEMQYGVVPPLHIRNFLINL